MIEVHGGKNKEINLCDNYRMIIKEYLCKRNLEAMVGINPERL